VHAPLTIAVCRVDNRFTRTQGPTTTTTLAKLDPCLVLSAGSTADMYTTSPIASTADDVGNQGSWGDPEASRKPFDYQSFCYAEENARASAWTKQRADLPHPAAAARATVRARAAGDVNAAAQAPSSRDGVKVALLQLAAATGADPLEASYAAAEPRIRAAASSGADVALLPEQWSVGYMGNMPNFSGQYFQRDSTQVAYRGYMSWATPLDGPYVEKFRVLARELNMAIALPFVQVSERVWVFVCGARASLPPCGWMY
jgi:hypothetical protein